MSCPSTTGWPGDGSRHAGTSNLRSLLGWQRVGRAIVLHRSPMAGKRTCDRVDVRPCGRATVLYGAIAPGYSALKTSAVGVRAAMRPGNAATRLATTIAPKPT